QERPEVRLRPDGGRDIHWPGSEFFAWDPGAGREGLLLFCGPEPHLKWAAYAKAFLDVAERCGVKRIVSLGTLLAGTPHHPPVARHRTLHRPRLALPPRSLGHLSSSDLRGSHRDLHDRPGGRGATGHVPPGLHGSGAALSARHGESRGHRSPPRLRRPAAPPEPGHLPPRPAHPAVPRPILHGPH